MFVEGTVTRVKALPPRDGQDQVTSVSIEGFGVLVGSDVESLPKRNQYIRAQVRSFWPKGGGKPVFWLGTWNVATV